ncbi:GTP-binding protein [uncultured Salinisphaera sp.]|uniref:CobW family GTP-binding protein n=1 Tax=uncultured Salinisphaera sp. TaxID=359372 RepID=UPI0032B2A383
MKHRKTIPVTLLTGFLGSGKTTLINTLLADPRMRDAAIVVNEYGSVAVDHDLIHEGREGFALTTSTGCLCCTASSDIRASLYELHDRYARGELPAFNHVVVETTGLADPAPIINSLIAGGTPAMGLRDHVVARSFLLAGVIATFDVDSGDATLAAHAECRKQLAFADHIVLTKTDLADAAPWPARLRRINPTASLHDCQAANFDATALFNQGTPYVTADRPENVLEWLAMERATTAHDHHQHDHDHDHDHDHHAHRHDDGIEAWPLFCDTPLERAAVDRFLETITDQPGAALLRLKGIFALSDDPARPLVVHAVQHRLYPPVRLDAWPSVDRRSRVVLIGRDLPRAPIEALLAKVDRPTHV